MCEFTPLGCCLDCPSFRLYDEFCCGRQIKEYYEPDKDGDTFAATFWEGVYGPYIPDDYHCYKKAAWLFQHKKDLQESIQELNDYLSNNDYPTLFPNY